MDGRTQLSKAGSPVNNPACSHRHVCAHKAGTRRTKRDAHSAVDFPAARRGYACVLPFEVEPREEGLPHIDWRPQGWVRFKLH
ncbi:hypothetical protein EYF80_017856 [Liparis tanakae]|uniref:Uncharacterized protein n=1 Tax=Liparis tanakae TaxID=230148 RepID=A0A4Z2I178_9TELE|nr:hypothetical protein EYF80_017856 [Liparis tanakae]